MALLCIASAAQCKYRSRSNTSIWNDDAQYCSVACAQALVEQCAVAGQPEQVERCVLRMDVASLDFSQVSEVARAGLF